MGRRTNRRLGRGILAGLLALIFTSMTSVVQSYQLSPSVTKWRQQIQDGYDRRVAADPSFLQKSFTEVLLAAGTQLAAEWNRRGSGRLLAEVDFVLPAI